MSSSSSKASSAILVYRLCRSSADMESTRPLLPILNDARREKKIMRVLVSFSIEARVPASLYAKLRELRIDSFIATFVMHLKILGSSSNKLKKMKVPSSVHEDTFIVPRRYLHRLTKVPSLKRQNFDMFACPIVGSIPMRFFR